MNSSFKRKLRRVLLWVTIVLSAGLIMNVAFVLAVREGFFGPLPSHAALTKIRQNNASSVMSADGELLGLFYYQNRTNAKIDEIPQSLIDALVATEDARFYRHNGFDVRSFGRVLIKSILLFDRSSGGGSTITQQLAKNLFPRRDFSLMSLPVAKVKEIITAERLEKIYTKREILELYLNTVPFGENTYGIETASLTYFDKKPDQLNLQESAMLVGLLKANTGYNPRLHHNAALERRNTVIAQMVKYGYLDPQSGDSLQNLPLVLHYTSLTHNNGLAPYFREYVRREAEGILDNYNTLNDTLYNLYADGLTIYTTLDARLQRYAEQAATEHMSRLQDIINRQWQKKRPWLRNPGLADLQIRQSTPYKKFRKRGLTHDQAVDSMRTVHPTRIFTWQGEKDTLMSSLDSVLYHFDVLQCGVLAVEGQTGKVRVWIGGSDFRYFKYDHVLAARQVGSTIKPLIYATAMEHGVKPCDYIKNDSVAYPEAQGWVPRNADNKYGGYYSVQGALVNSVNTISVKLLMQTGIPTVVRTLYDAGITAALPEVPSLALGSAEIPLYQMAPAYATFVNDGRNPGIYTIDSITDRHGNLIYRHEKEPQHPRVFSTETQQRMQAMLKGVTERGTAAALRSRYGLHGDFGGKTGTTQDHTDGWFMGVTPEMVMGVWVGADNPAVHFKTLRTGQGSRTAMPVFALLMQKAEADPKTAKTFEGSFDIPPQVYDKLRCYDFEENRNVFDFLTKKPTYDELNKKPPRQTQKAEKKQTKVGKFLRRIFGKKKKK